MAEMDDRLERLICRRLDGEITADEQGELDALLGESPEAREAWKSYRRQDEAVGGVLRDVLGGVSCGENDGARALTVRREKGAGRTVRFGRPRLALGVAAAVVVLVGSVLHFGPAWRRDAGGRADVAPSTNGNAGIEGGTDVAAEVLPAQDVVIAVYPPQAVNREVLGVVGEDGKTIYLVEMDHTRTAVVPVGAGL